MNEIFVVGQLFEEEGKQWEFQGVFSTKELAEAACRDWTYFVGSAVLDQELPHGTTEEWPGAYFPISRLYDDLSEDRHALALG